MTKSIAEMTDEEWSAYVDETWAKSGAAEFELKDDWLTEIEWEAPFVDPYVYVIGLDPGGTTGVACVRLPSDNFQAKPELGYLHQIEDGRYGFKTFFGKSEIAENVIIVSEKWKERNVKGADREPQYIEGGIHMLWGEENVVWQYPDQKELIPDQWLKDNNLWTEGKRHQMDALKHVFAYLRNNGNSATIKSLSGMDDEPMAQPGDAQAAQLADENGDDEGQASMGEAMQALAEAAEAAAEAMEQLEEALGEGPADADATDAWATDDTENHGDSGHGGEVSGYTSDDEEDKRSRKQRKLNDAFAGYNPADEETTNTTVLFED